jgi:hypothetical protein
MERSEHFINKQMRQNTPFRILPTGEGYYITAQGNLTEKQFDSLYPIDGDIKVDNGKGENSDRTKSWINGGKSY